MKCYLFAMTKNLKIALLILVPVCAIMAGGWFFFGGDGLPLEADPDNQQQVEAGAKIYAGHCASCHGVKLEGQANWRSPLATGGLPAPPHDDSGHTWHHPDQVLFRYTKLGGAEIAPAGFKSNMPGFNGVISDGQIWAVLSFIKNKWPNNIRRRQAGLNER